MTGRTSAAIKKPAVKKPTRPTRPEPIDPPAPPGPDFPNPWFPDLAIHLYGSNWDFEIYPNDSADRLALKAGVRDALQGALGQALSALLPAAATPDVQLAYDLQYAGNRTNMSLSIGFWLEPLGSPVDAAALAARRNGLLRLRKDGQANGSGELTLRFGLIEAFLRRTLAGMVTSLPRDAPRIALSGVTIVPAGASVNVAAFLSTAVPVLDALHHQVEMRVDFGSRRGDLTIDVANVLVSGDFLTETLDATVFLPLLMPPFGRFAPRVVHASGLKFTLDYQRPIIETRGQAQFLSGQQALVVPLAWTIGARLPRVSVSGPRVVSITGAQKTVQYTATTSDMFSPVFTWKLNNRVQAGSGSTISITYRAGTQQPGTLKSARIEVTATEPAPPHEQRSASMTSTVRVIVVDV